MKGKSTGKYNFRTCRLRRKYGSMNFSFEELYQKYGQYELTVMVYFHPTSESYRKLGNYIIGTFRFTQAQREEQEKIKHLKPVPRSNKKIQFISSPFPKLTDEQKIFLDKEGFFTADVQSVSFVNTSKSNTFIKKGNKKLPKKILIPVNDTTKKGYLLNFNFYKNKIKNNYTLVEIEKDEYYGLKLYFEPENITDQETKDLTDSETGKIKSSIREYYLRTKSEIEGLTEEENTESETIKKTYWEKNRLTLENELKKSGQLWKKIPIKHQYKLLLATCSFKSEVLVDGIKTIWWDTKRFLHIMIRHTNDLQVGNFKKRTTFQYDYENIRELIENVLISQKNEIADEFSQHPNKPFIRQNNRAVYYNGNYYRIEIEPSGRLLTFHPYNDDKERLEENEKKTDS